MNKAYVDHPFEEDPCHCHFRFTNLGGEGELVLKYQWFLGGKTPTDFVAIPGASSEVYYSFKAKKTRLRLLYTHDSSMYPLVCL